jgi:hypothetical protein
MKSFKAFITESRVIGKKMGHDLYVHKDYTDNIPKDVHDNALNLLHKEHPDFKHNIVKYNKKTNNISFLNSPDFDTEHEPHIHDSVIVKPEGTTKYIKPLKVPWIYHQKHEFVGDDYKGFDIDRSKKRAVQYKTAIQKVADEKGVPTKQISSRIGNRDYWKKEIVPHIKED